MRRAANIFHNVVTNEDHTTELLCNLTRFAAFRRPFLSLLLGRADIGADVEWEDIDTQIDLSGYGRADICIRRVARVRVIPNYKSEGAPGKPAVGLPGKFGRTWQTSLRAENL